MANGTTGQPASIPATVNITPSAVAIFEAVQNGIAKADGFIPMVKSVLEMMGQQGIEADTQAIGGLLILMGQEFQKL